MMFDPPDYPFKELSETYDLLFHNDPENRGQSSNFINNPTDVSMIINAEANQLSNNYTNSNGASNVESSLFQESSLNIQSNNGELQIVQSENLFNFEPTLLDENTVNQFLLPLQNASELSKDLEIAEPDLLALHSCVICHEIFPTEADLLDHTISLHTSSSETISTLDHSENSYLLANMNNKEVISCTEGSTINNDSFETEWLVCKICERVLSTALEVEPTEQLCCIDADNKVSISSRKLTTMYVCELCSGLFADGDALDTHRLSCFIVNENYCENLNDNCNYDNVTRCTEIPCPWDTCNKQCSSKDELKTHMMDCHRSPPVRNQRRVYTNSTNNKMWNCGSCNQLFATARELYGHKRGEDRPQGAPLMAYVCEECDKVLGSMCALHTHKKMHKVTKPGYSCRVCGRRFNQSGHLAIHMRMHTGERPYPCDLCPKAFKVKVERDDHRRTHTGERPFACTACPKTFTAAARLREHARIHTDQRPYRCDICGAAFRRPYARTVHTLIHTGEKPHECDICGTAFRRSGDMWKHKRTLHGVQSMNIETEPKK